VPLGNAFRLPTDVRPVRYALRFDLDLEAWRFQGHERLEMVTDHRRREIVLHARDIEIARAAAGARPLEVTPETAAHAVVLRFAEPVGPGPVTVELDFAGPIRPDLKALYRSTRGDERYAITTLWPAESRRLFPCFDEPPFKARFALELTAPHGLVAIANARLLETSDDGGGRTRWRFGETPPLSPYLLAFAVGPFEGTEVVSTATGIPVRIWLPRGLAADGVYARDAQRRCIEWLEGYTGVPYPYDKVEGLGVPDFPAGAMENPGAVTYRLELVAADPAKASVRALKSCVGVAAHELTHMWWGDLVTLAWWDDLWLSESFATFVGNKTEDALHPEWGIWRDFVAGTTRGFALDSLASTHPIHAAAATAEAAVQRVDPITYQKGAAVLRMIESYLGAETFRDGVRLYLERFRESSAVAADFWRALDDASGRDVTRVAQTWITEPGHPLVELARDKDGRVALRQRRFFLDPDAPASDQRWPIPLLVRTPSGETRALLDGTTGSLELDAAAWIHPNARAAGFYRFSLDGDLRERLLDHVDELDAAERLLLLDNDWALTRAGMLRASDHVALLRALARERDRAVLAVAYEQLRWVAVHALTPRAERTFAALVEGLFRPALARLGSEPRDADSEEDQELRPLAIRALGELARAPDVRDEAAKRIRAHLAGERQDRNLVAAWAAVAATDGDALLHGRYLARVRETAGREPQEEERFREALPVFRDEAATAATIAAIDDGTIRDQDLPGIFFEGLRNVAAREAYWRALRERYAPRIAPLEGLVRNAVLSSTGQLSPPTLAREADTFLAAVAEPESREVVARTRESLRLHSRAAQRIREELAALR